MGKVKKELERIEQLGVISRIEEPTEWCSGMVVAPKKSGEIRICVDLSPLNNAVCREKFLLPSVDQTLGMPSDAVIFSKLHGILAEHFQNRMVTEVTAGLEGVVCHMDDILIWGWTQAEHDARVHTVLERAQKAGVTLNTAKCDFTRFIPNLAEKDKALRDLLSKKNQWFWGPDQQKAFTSLKHELSSTPVLQLYDPNKDLKISADASSYGLGAVIPQKHQDVWSPVAYASRSLTSTEQRYAQVEKEALALTWACERFRDFIIGLHFKLETDHKPLVSLLGGQALDSLPPRIQRFRMRLMRYSYIITHVPGKTLTTADTLSRAPLKQGGATAGDGLMEETNIYVDSVMENLPASDAYLTELRQQLSTDSVCSQVMKYCTEGWPDRNRLEAMPTPYRALLAYRATPLSNGYSPAQLLMGRRLRTTLPTFPAALEPDIPDLRKVQRRERERRWMDVSNYNQRHGGRNRSNLAPGVWITHTKTTGTVTSAHPTPRSYLVNGPQGTGGTGII
ncbi:hypothetical protein SKAU_G00424270 [Synaphobranchus kaupii]|uniref:Reverse transcriptase/retrotransposon-derived protein RNase H-like domain-containing protein n=1 Tax=Synaphobranchus kaupii TaxID=118154 RepID=A0A9Q1I8Q9_SYNKA|nr:hypothetical protein SKAU_G00424270 [Synaphobranchus kaupii]